MFPPRFGSVTPAQTKGPPEDFWPPRTLKRRADLGHAPVSEPAMLLRLAGVVAVVAIIVAAALMAA